MIVSPVAGARKLIVMFLHRMRPACESDHDVAAMWNRAFIRAQLPSIITLSCTRLGE